MKEFFRVKKATSPATSPQRKTVYLVRQPNGKLIPTAAAPTGSKQVRLVIRPPAPSASGSPVLVSPRPAPVLTLNPRPPLALNRPRHSAHIRFASPGLTQGRVIQPNNQSPVVKSPAKNPNNLPLKDITSPNTQPETKPLKRFHPITTHDRQDVPLPEQIVKTDTQPVESQPIVPTDALDHQVPQKIMKIDGEPPVESQPIVTDDTVPSQMQEPINMQHEQPWEMPQQIEAPNTVGPGEIKQANTAHDTEPSHPIATTETESSQMAQLVKTHEAQPPMESQSFVTPDTQANDMSQQFETPDLEPCQMPQQNLNPDKDSSQMSEPNMTQNTEVSVEVKSQTTQIPQKVAEPNIEPCKMSQPATAHSTEPLQISQSIMVPNAEPCQTPNPIVTPNEEGGQVSAPIMTPCITADTKQSQMPSQMHVTTSKEPDQMPQPVVTPDAVHNPISQPMTTPNTESQPTVEYNVDPCQMPQPIGSSQDSEIEIPLTTEAEPGNISQPMAVPDTDPCQISQPITQTDTEPDNLTLPVISQSTESDEVNQPLALPNTDVPHPTEEPEVQSPQQIVTTDAPPSLEAGRPITPDMQRATPEPIPHQMPLSNSAPITEPFQTPQPIATQETENAQMSQPIKASEPEHWQMCPPIASSDMETQPVTSTVREQYQICETSTVAATESNQMPPIEQVPLTTQYPGGSQYMSSAEFPILSTAQVSIDSHENVHYQESVPSPIIHGPLQDKTNMQNHTTGQIFPSTHAPEVISSNEHSFEQTENLQPEGFASIHEYEMTTNEQVDGPNIQEAINEATEEELNKICNEEQGVKVLKEIGEVQKTLVNDLHEEHVSEHATNDTEINDTDSQDVNNSVKEEMITAENVEEGNGKVATSTEVEVGTVQLVQSENPLDELNPNDINNETDELQETNSEKKQVFHPSSNTDGTQFSQEKMGTKEILNNQDISRYLPPEGVINNEASDTNTENAEEHYSQQINTNNESNEPSGAYPETIVEIIRESDGQILSTTEPILSNSDSPGVEKGEAPVLDKMSLLHGGDGGDAGVEGTLVEPPILSPESFSQEQPSEMEIQPNNNQLTPPQVPQFLDPDNNTRRRMSQDQGRTKVSMLKRDKGYVPFDWGLSDEEMDEKDDPEKEVVQDDNKETPNEAMSSIDKHSNCKTDSKIQKKGYVPYDWGLSDDENEDKEDIHSIVKSIADSITTSDAEPYRETSRRMSRNKTKQVVNKDKQDKTPKLHKNQSEPKRKTRSSQKATPERVQRKTPKQDSNETPKRKTKQSRSIDRKSSDGKEKSRADVDEITEENIIHGRRTRERRRDVSYKEKEEHEIYIYKKKSRKSIDETSNSKDESEKKSRKSTDETTPSKTEPEKKSRKSFDETTPLKTELEKKSRKSFDGTTTSKTEPEKKSRKSFDETTTSKTEPEATVIDEVTKENIIKGKRKRKTRKDVKEFIEEEKAITFERSSRNAKKMKRDISPTKKQPAIESKLPSDKPETDRNHSTRKKKDISPIKSEATRDDELPSTRYEETKTKRSSSIRKKHESATDDELPSTSYEEPETKRSCSSLDNDNPPDIKVEMVGKAENTDEMNESLTSPRSKASRFKKETGYIPYDWGMSDDEMNNLNKEKNENIDGVKRIEETDGEARNMKEDEFVHVVMGKSKLETDIMKEERKLKEILDSEDNVDYESDETDHESEAEEYERIETKASERKKNWRDSLILKQRDTSDEEMDKTERLGDFKKTSGPEKSLDKFSRDKVMEKVPGPSWLEVQSETPDFQKAFIEKSMNMASETVKPKIGNVKSTKASHFKTGDSYNPYDWDMDDNTDGEMNSANREKTKPNKISKAATDNKPKNESQFWLLGKGADDNNSESAANENHARQSKRKTEKPKRKTAEEIAPRTSPFNTQFSSSTGSLVAKSKLESEIDTISMILETQKKSYAKAISQEKMNDNDLASHKDRQEQGTIAKSPLKEIKSDMNSPLSSPKKLTGPLKKKPSADSKLNITKQSTSPVKKRALKDGKVETNNVLLETREAVSFDEARLIDAKPSPPAPKLASLDIFGKHLPQKTATEARSKINQAWETAWENVWNKSKQIKTEKPDGKVDDNRKRSSVDNYEYVEQKKKKLEQKENQYEKSDTSSDDMVDDFKLMGWEEEEWNEEEDKSANNKQEQQEVNTGKYEKSLPLSKSDETPRKERNEKFFKTQRPKSSTSKDKNILVAEIRPQPRPLPGQPENNPVRRQRTRLEDMRPPRPRPIPSFRNLPDQEPYESDETFAGHESDRSDPSYRNQGNQEQYGSDDTYEEPVEPQQPIGSPTDKLAELTELMKKQQAEIEKLKAQVAAQSNRGQFTQLNRGRQQNTIPAPRGGRQNSIPASRTQSSYDRQGSESQQRTFTQTNRGGQQSSIRDRRQLHSVPTPRVQSSYQSTPQTFTQTNRGRQHNSMPVPRKQHTMPIPRTQTSYESTNNETRRQKFPLTFRDSYHPTREADTCNKPEPARTPVPVKATTDSRQERRNQLSQHLETMYHQQSTSSGM